MDDCPGLGAPPEDSDEEDLGALGFMFDAAAPKRWVQHTFGPVVTEVSCLDDTPGALQSGQFVWPAAPALAAYLVRQWPHLNLPPSW
jgi:hypothetical protein